MQIPIIPFRGQKKPWGSIPRINWGHPLARGLVFYGYDAGGVIIDLVNGSLGKIFASTNRAIRTPSKFGTGFKFAGTTTDDSVSLPISNAKVSSFANSVVPFSQAVGVFPRGAATLGAYIASVAATNDNCGFVTGNGSATAAQANFAFGGTQVTYTQTYTANIYHTLVAVATTAAAGNLYFDGQGAQAFSGTTVLVNTGQQVNFNTGSPGTTTFGGGINGFVYYYAGWQSRTLTQTDAALLHADPYCFLIYPEDEILATLTGSTTPPTPGPGPNFLTSLLPMMGVG